LINKICLKRRVKLDIKKILIKSTVYVLCIILGMIIYRADYFPRPQFRQIKNYFYPIQIQHIEEKIYNNFIPFILTPYKARTPLFSDRDYYDTIGDKRLENSFLVQIPRHFNSSIQIEVYRPVIIYRLLNITYNDNTIFHDWKKTNIEVSVNGVSCNHTAVVSKIFESGKIILNSGGPATASPILIQDLSSNPINWPIKIIMVDK